jgi:uncharacterized protein (DUF885 family)
MKTIRGFALLCLLGLFCPAARAGALDDLAHDFWGWRAAEQPVSGDDIPRIERPAGWVPDWSPAAAARYQQELERFEARWKQMDTSSWPVWRQVDYRLMGSAIARVRWELLVNRSWQRDPGFYLDQTLGAYVLLLLPPAPFDAGRSRDIVGTLRSFPGTVAAAEQNLSQPAAPFARLALARLENVRGELTASTAALKPLLAPAAALELDAAAADAAAALESYRAWLNQRLAGMSQETAIGRDGYVFFLKNVALLPYTPEQLLEIGQLEWARAVAKEMYEQHGHAGLPPLRLLKDQRDQMGTEISDELAIRNYLEAKDLLTVPSWVQHYRYLPLPAYLAPFGGAEGEEDDFTSPSRLKENGVRYVAEPWPDLGYFALSMAEDPRAITVHEGVPGHYFQLVLSWSHPDPIRRHYYDSGANEGIGFYAEEMMLDAGLFDNSPRTREIIANFMRLRALRVEVDVKLALGKFTLGQAADYLHASVPMDAHTALEEASSFAAGPGQAISYQIGKVQILRMLADARRAKGADFSLRALHDFVWLNGNVPLALQRWEYLGLRDDVDAADRLR